MTKRKAVRPAVIQAAVDLIETTGVATLTLEAVSAAAGVSKGGLLHYFRSKEALLTAVIQHHADQHEAEWLKAVAAAREASADGTCDEAALMATYLQRAFTGTSTRPLSARALFGIAAYHPSLLEPVRAYFNRRAQSVQEERTHPAAMLAFMLLADGLTLFDALDAPPFDDGLRDDVHRFVRDLAHRLLAPTGPAAPPSGE